MATAQRTPVFPTEKALDGIRNWLVFKSTVISNVRSAGLLGYLDGTIPRSSASTSTLIIMTSMTTTANSSTPFVHEWDLCDAWVAGIIYQNVTDPNGHSLNANESGASMWKKLTTKYDQKTELVKSRARDDLRTAKFVDGGERMFPEHLKLIVKLQTQANTAGCGIDNAQMIPILFNSLPSLFALAIQVQQGKKDYSAVAEDLSEWWMLANKDKASSSTVNALTTVTKSVTKAEQSTVHQILQVLLTAQSGRPKCTNCGRIGHTHENCWAAGGGSEGKAPKGWKAPKGKQPKNSESAMLSSSGPSVAATIITPMETYALSTFAPDEYGMLPIILNSLHLVDQSNRLQCRGEASAVLDCVDVGEGEGINSVPYARTVHTNILSSSIPTYLDSGASIHCVKD